MLLDFHNETWNDDAEIDCKTFVGMMLEAIAFYSNASVQLHYTDGDLFWGHPIVVSITADASFEDAQIAG